ncbi:MAG: hypothetical protein AB8B56_05940 [Crocinitomicaceae bacterium]
MIRQNKFFLFIILMLSSQLLSAQSFNIKEMPLSVAYYGENAFHPGIKLGTYYTVWSVEKTRTYRSLRRKEKYGTKIKLKELNVDFNIGGYSHPNNPSGYFVNTGLTFLRTKMRKKRQLGISFEVGYLRRDYKFETYELDEDGTIRTIPAAGNNALSFGLAPQFGQEFSIADHPVRFYCKPIFQLVQYGHSFQPNASLEVGTVINIHRKK